MTNKSPQKIFETTVSTFRDYCLTPLVARIAKHFHLPLEFGIIDYQSETAFNGFNEKTD
jgi:hypothetical protein